MIPQIFVPSFSTLLSNPDKAIQHQVCCSERHLYSVYPCICLFIRAWVYIKCFLTILDNPDGVLILCNLYRYVLQTKRFIQSCACSRLSKSQQMSKLLQYLLYCVVPGLIGVCCMFNYQLLGIVQKCVWQTDYYLFSGSVFSVFR